MGKKEKRLKKEKRIEKKDKETLNEEFFKNLLSILPLVILLVISINSFIFYYLPSKSGLVFLYDLFGNGNLIILSSYGVVTVLGFMLLITKKLDKTTKNILYIYAFISSFYFTGAPSFLYNKLLSSELNWTGYLYIEYFWELISFYFIIYAIKNFKKKFDQSFLYKLKNCI